MIKNIIFDIGGIIFDDSLDNISKVLGFEATNIYRKAYGKLFRECLLGNLDVDDYIKTFKDDVDYEKIKYILSKENQHLVLPLIKENFDYICKLKDKYNLYILSNITKESYEYINSVININKVFLGGVYSFKEGIVKPNKEIYELILKRYNLNKNETIFFDDKKRNIDIANEIGITAILFKKISDISNNLE